MMNKSTPIVIFALFSLLSISPASAKGTNLGRAVITVDDDAPANFSTIQAALASVPAKGATIYVRGGIYTPTATLTLSVASTRIVGDGPDVTRINAPGGIANVFNVTAADCEIANLEIDGLRGSQAVMLDSSTSVGIYIKSARAWLKNLHIHNTRSNGVTIEGAADVRVENSRIEGGATDPKGTAGGHNKGIYVSGAGALRPRILNNTITGWSQAIGLWYGVKDALVEKNDILHNYGYEDAAHQINRSATEDYGGVTGANARNRWLDNLVDGSTAGCFEIAGGGEALVIRGNVCSNASDIGAFIGVTGEGTAHLKEILIEGNTVMGNADSLHPGIQVNGHAFGTVIRANIVKGFNNASNGGAISIGGAYVFGDVRIDANIVSESQTGIALYGNQDGTRITNNTVTGAATGIRVSAGGRHQIAYNVVTNATGNALLMDSTAGDGSRVTNNRFTSTNNGGVMLIMRGDNLIRENSVEANTESAYGAIRLYGQNALRNMVKENIVNVTSGYVIYVDGGADYNVIQQNQVVNGTMKTENDAGIHNTVGPNYATSGGGVFIF